MIYLVNSDEQWSGYLPHNSQVKGLDFALVFLCDNSLRSPSCPKIMHVHINGKSKLPIGGQTETAPPSSV